MDWALNCSCFIWRVRSVAPQARWRLPADSWMLGECFWKARLGRGLLEKEIAVGWISGRKVARCLLWGILAVVRVRGEAWVVLKGGVLGSMMVELWKEWWSVVSRISGEMGLGCSEGLWRIEGDSGLNSGRGRKGKAAGCFVVSSV